MDHDDSEPHDHDLGLAHDLSTLLARRSALRLIAGAGLVTLAACASDNSSGASTSTTASTTATTAASTTTSAAGGTTTTASGATATTPIPEETAGPYPGDGSNGPDVLSESGVVRADIRSSFGSSTTTAQGVPLTIRFEVFDASTGDPKSAVAVYVWHCDRDGQYSMYGQAVTNENYLRGVQPTGTDGVVEFKSIFPACYSGRWPHIHFEVYASAADATGGGIALATSQIALPKDACQTVYATDGYSQSVTNLSQVSLATDMVFSDGWTTELGTVTGDPSSGMTVSLNVPV